MRVLTVIDSLAVGGAEQSLAALAPHLVDRGIDLHVAFLADAPGVEQQLRAAGVTLHSLDGRGGRAGGLWRVLKAIRSIRPDLVHTTLFEADIVGRPAAWLLRVPVVSSFVSEAYGPEHVRNPEYRPWKVRAGQLVDALTARLVTQFHAVSVSTADVMAHRLRVPRSKIDVVSRGRDPKRLGERTAPRRERTRKELGISNGMPLVLAVGRHFHMKGLDLLVRAFPNVVARFPDARLLIAGREGPATSALRQLVNEGNISGSVTLAGYRSDVADLMSAADVFVLPSRAEGCPGALIEAMALEVPTVAADIPSVREVAGRSQPTVVLAEAESAEELANAIIWLLEDREQAALLAAAARQRFLGGYTLEAIADQTIDLYRRTADYD